MSLKRKTAVLAIAITTAASAANAALVGVWGERYDINVIADFYNTLPETTANVLEGPLDAINLASYDLLWAVQPADAYTSAEIAAMSTFLADGNRIAFMGEHAGYAPDENARINAALAALGSSISIINVSKDGNTYTATVDNGQIKLHPLTAGVNSYQYNWFSPLNIGPNAQILMTGQDDPSTIMMAFENIGEGSIFLITDENVWDLSGLTNFDNGILFANLIGASTDPVMPEDILEEIATTPNMGSTAMVIVPACVASNSEDPNSRFSRDCNALVRAALVGDDQTMSALGAITAEEATVPLTSARANMGMQRQILSARLAALRGSGTNSGLAMRAAPGFDGLTDGGLTGGAASADNASGQVFGDERFGVFFNGNGSSGNKDATQNESGFDFDTWNFAFGADYRLRDNLVLGLAGGYSKNDVKIDNNGGRLDSESYSLSLYGSFFHGDHFYVDGILSYASNDYDQKRNVIYQLTSGSANQTASADYDGDQWSAALNAGYSLSWGALTYGPVARLEYVDASVDGYRERMSDPNAAGAGWATRMDDISQESFTMALGGEVSQAISTSWGVLIPQLHLSWVHEFKNDALSVNGSFIEDPIDGVFRIRSDRPDTDYFNARLGVSAQLAGGVSAFAYYNTVLGYRDLDVDTFGAGLRMTF